MYDAESRWKEESDNIKDIWIRGYDDGYRDGHEDGDNEGYTEGYTDGHEDGCKKRNSISEEDDDDLYDRISIVSPKLGISREMTILSIVVLVGTVLGLTVAHVVKLLFLSGPPT